MTSDMWPQALLACSLGVNALVAGLVLWGWGSGGRQLGERLYVEPNRMRRRSFFDAFPVTAGDVVFLGDSLTANAQWHEMFPERPVKNRGIGGDTTATLLARLDQVIAGTPATVLLMIGTNDLALGVPQPRILANYGAILERLRAGSPSTAVVVQSVLPRGRSFVDRIHALNVAVARMAADRGCRFVDLTSVFAGPDGAIAPGFSNDGLHLLGPAYVAWRGAIAPVVDGRG